MALEYQIIRCCECETFQVQQKKKVKRFTCRLCGQKQSLQRIYGQSYKAKDLRPLVQEYNMNEGSRKEIEEATKQKRKQSEHQEDDLEDFLTSHQSKVEKVEEGLKNSVWNEYKYEESESEAEEEVEADPSISLSFDAYPQLSGKKRKFNSRTGNKRKRRSKPPTSSYSGQPKVKPVSTQKASFPAPLAPTVPQKAPIQAPEDIIPKKNLPMQHKTKSPTTPSNSVWAKFQYDNSSEEESEE